MTKAKPPKTATPPKKQRHAVLLALRDKDDQPDDATARILTRPEVQAAAVIQIMEGDNHDINSLIRELSGQVAAVNRGDLSRAEAMLIAQAHTLDEIFSSLARRSCRNINGGYLNAAECYMRLALKAQSQCRTTLEALAEIKNPRPVAFVRQANISNGPQQVNNGTSALSRPREIKTEQNQLSEGGNELLPDTRAQGAESGANSTLEAVGKIDGAKVPRG